MKHEFWYLQFIVHRLVTLNFLLREGKAGTVPRCNRLSTANSVLVGNNYKRSNNAVSNTPVSGKLYHYICYSESIPDRGIF
jgi:hypothetical protein